VRELLPFKTFVSTNVVLEMPAPIDLDLHLETIDAGLFRDFPDERIPTGVPQDAPPPIPRFLFVSHESRLEVAPIQLKYSIQYSGNAQRSYSICDRLIRTRIEKVFGTFLPGITDHFSFAGVVHNVSLGYAGTYRENPALDLAQKYLRLDVGSQYIQDVEFRIGLRHDDTYFINMSCTNHEVKGKSIRAAAPGLIRVVEHEMETTDTGITIIVDVNTKLFNRVNHRFPEIRYDNFSELLDLMKTVMDKRIDSLISEGRI
jgi:hypothetical protein